MRRLIGIVLVILIVIIGIIVNIWIIENISPGVFDYEYKVGNGSYTLHRNSADVIYIAPNNGYSSKTEIIPEKIVEVAWNNRYVIAKQYGMKKESLDKTYEIPDESIVNYWILDTEMKIIYGPFLYEEFLLNVQKFDLTNLELKPPIDYVED